MTKDEVTDKLAARLAPFHEGKKYPGIEDDIREAVRGFMKELGFYPRVLDVWIDEEGMICINAKDYVKAETVA